MTDSASDGDIISLAGMEHLTAHGGTSVRTSIRLKGCPLRCPWCDRLEAATSDPVVLFDAERCTSCGRCVLACPTGAVHVTDGRFAFEPENCARATVSHDCHACVDACPGGALSIPETRLTVSQIVERACADRDRYGSDWEGITLSGGEPLMHVDWCLPLAKALNEAGLDVAIETCGNVYPATVRQVEPFFSTFYYNFMSIAGNRLAEVTGVDLRIVRANLQWLLVRCPQKVMVRIPVIDGFNDDPSELRVTVDWLVGEGVQHLELLAPGLLGINCSRPASSIPAIPHAAMSSSVLTNLKRHAESLGVDASVGN